MIETKLFAFWRHDLYPYILGSEITEINDKGSVYAKSYRMWFAPLLVLPLESGENLYEKIKILKYEYREAQSLLDNEFMDKLTKLTPKLAPDKK